MLHEMIYGFQQNAVNVCSVLTAILTGESIALEQAMLFFLLQSATHYAAE